VDGIAGSASEAQLAATDVGVLVLEIEVQDYGEARGLFGAPVDGGQVGRTRRPGCRAGIAARRGHHQQDIVGRAVEARARGGRGKLLANGGRKVDVGGHARRRDQAALNCSLSAGSRRTLAWSFMRASRSAWAAADSR